MDESESMWQGFNPIHSLLKMQFSEGRDEGFARHFGPAICLRPMRLAKSHSGLQPGANGSKPLAHKLSPLVAGDLGRNAQVSPPAIKHEVGSLFTSQPQFCGWTGYHPSRQSINTEKKAVKCFALPIYHGHGKHVHAH